MPEQVFILNQLVRSILRAKIGSNQAFIGKKFRRSAGFCANDDEKPGKTI